VVQIAPTKVRGSLGSINQLVICIGIVAALVVNVVIPATSWRTMFYLASLPPLLLALGGWTRFHLIHPLQHSACSHILLPVMNIGKQNFGCTSEGIIFLCRLDSYA
jgi:MFS family permease